MRGFRVFAYAVAVLLMFSAPSMAGDFDFLADINIAAKADLGAFVADLGIRFGLPVPKVEEVVHAVAAPADAFMVLKVAEVAQVPPVQVVEEYKKNKGKGWGVIAQNMGIKPGSAAFMELKKQEKVGGGKGKSGAKENKGKGKK